jgi:hypothetical protein
MLDGTSRPTNPENEPNGIHQELGRAAYGNPNRLQRPRSRYLTRSLSFLVKQPGGLGYRMHSKCSKCSKQNKQNKQNNQRKQQQQPEKPAWAAVRDVAPQPRSQPWGFRDPHA